ncbi:MAG: YtxH domain-containing protein, partial [Chloroflexia bacterium]|nr:YtxH domain-containing protein [Chloroflexia bacterium]
IDDQRHQLEDNLEGIEGKLKGASDQAHEKVQETKDQVQEKIEEVQQKVQDAADWRQQFDKRPMVGLGVAFGGGFLLAGLLGGGSKKKDDKSQSASYSYPPQYQNPQYQSHGGTEIGRQHMSSTMDNIKGALMGVAAAQAKSFLGQSVPSFDDEYRKVEKENSSSDNQRQTSGDTSQSASYPVHASDRQELAGDR